jgi:competence protein ComEA
MNLSPPTPEEHSWLLRRGEQAVLVSVIAASLLAMLAAWLYQGGQRGRLIEIERAAPVEIPYVVDINTATWPELAQLPDIGETLAKRIVESRDAQGPFRDHDDLRRVRGIGPKTLDGMRPYLLPMPNQESLVTKKGFGQVNVNDTKTSGTSTFCC